MIITYTDNKHVLFLLPRFDVWNSNERIQILQVTTNVLKNRASVSMAPPVSQLGNLSDATALHVTEETDVTTVLTDSREMAVRNALRTTTVIIVVRMTLFYGVLAFVAMVAF